MEVCSEEKVLTIEAHVTRHDGEIAFIFTSLGFHSFFQISPFFIPFDISELRNMIKLINKTNFSL